MNTENAMNPPIHFAEKKSFHFEFSKDIPSFTDFSQDFANIYKPENTSPNFSGKAESLIPCKVDDCFPLIPLLHCFPLTTVLHHLKRPFCS